MGPIAPAAVPGANVSRTGTFATFAVADSLSMMFVTWVIVLAAAAAATAAAAAAGLPSSPPSSGLCPKWSSKHVGHCVCDAGRSCIGECSSGHVRQSADRPAHPDPAGIIGEQVLHGFNLLRCPQCVCGPAGSAAELGLVSPNLTMVSCPHPPRAPPRSRPARHAHGPIVHTGQEGGTYAGRRF